jgi:hypothetical protein
VKKVMALLLCVTAVATAQVTTTFYGGLAIAIGEGSSDMNPGIAACVEPIGKISKYFGLGGHLDYAWLSVRKPSNLTMGDFRAGVHFWDISLVPKGYLPVADNSNVALEFDPGVYLTYSYINGGGESHGEVKPYFGLTTGVSFNINAFAVGFKIKNAFTEDHPTSWISFSVGYIGSGM